MKQFVYFLFSFVLLFSACNKDEDVTDPDGGCLFPPIAYSLRPNLKYFRRMAMILWRNYLAIQRKPMKMRRLFLF